MIEASIDIQHIMDYLPITYALQQQDVSKTMVDLKLLKEIPLIVPSINVKDSAITQKKMYSITIHHSFNSFSLKI